MKTRLTLLVSVLALCLVAMPVIAETLQLPGVGLQLGKTNVNVNLPNVNVPTQRVLPSVQQNLQNVPNIVPPSVRNVVSPVIPNLPNLTPQNISRPNFIPSISPNVSSPRLFSPSTAGPWLLSPNTTTQRVTVPTDATLPSIRTDVIARPSTLLSPPTATTLKIPTGDNVVIDKGAHVLISRDGDKMRIQNLTGVGDSVRVKVGDQEIKLDPGTELVAGTTRLLEEDIRPNDGIGRRNIKVQGNVAVAEIDVRAAVAHNPELRRLVTRPQDREERRLGREIMKTIAALLMLRGQDGFEEPPAPPPQAPPPQEAPQAVASNILPTASTNAQTESAAVLAAQQSNVQTVSPNVTNTFDQTRPLLGLQQSAAQQQRTTPPIVPPRRREGNRQVAQVPPAAIAPPVVPLIPVPAPVAISQQQSRPTPSAAVGTGSGRTTSTAAVPQSANQSPLHAVGSQLRKSVQEHPGLALALIILFAVLLAAVTGLLIANYRSRQEVGRLNRGLQAKIAELNELNEELTRTRDKAIEASRLKSEFVANISHEIRTPITAVLGMIGLLRETPRDPKDSDLLKMLDESARSLLTVINDILDFSKIEAGMLTIQSVDFNTKSLGREVVDLLSGQAKEKGLELALEVDADADLTVQGDPYRVRQVLLNLIGNAIKFTTAGSVLLKVQRGGENMIGFHVKDTGIGIPDDARNRLFQPFSQADGTTTRRFGGTGLGLSISKRLVELMGGTIDFRSEPGQGSEFWFVLPFQPSAAEEAAAAAAAATASAVEAARGKAAGTTGGAHAGRRILVAEDSPVLQRIVLHQLMSLQYEVTLAKNGREAVEAIQSGQFDLVLMDWQMPELDGIQATQEIRKLAQGTDVPIIAMTANAMEGDRVACLNAGMNDYISKPFTLEQLQKTIETWLPPPPDDSGATPTQPSSGNSQNPQ